MASHPRKLSHLTLIRFLCVLSRSAQRFLSVRACLVLFKSRAYLRENDQLPVRFHCARQDSPSAASKKNISPRPERAKGGRHGSFVPSSVPNFQGKIARVGLFDIDDGPIHRWGREGPPARPYFTVHTAAAMWCPGLEVSVAPRGCAPVHGRGTASARLDLPTAAVTVVMMLSSGSKTRDELR